MTTTSPRTADRILLVEDDPHLLGILDHQLRREGYDVRTASNGYDAGFQVHQFRPHLVLLDLMLPGVNGAEVCAQIRGDEALREIRIIGLSAATDGALLERFKRAGLDDFIPKPFKFHEVKERVERLIGPIRPDPSALERNRVLLYSTEEAWGREAARLLQAAGYAVESCSSPEAAGFTVARSKPDAILVRGVPEPVLAMLRSKGVPVVVTPPSPADAVSAVVAAVGSITRRRVHTPPSRMAVPVAAAVVAVLAVSIGALFIWPEGSRPAPPPDGQRLFEGVLRNDEEIQWIEMERRVRDQHLVYYMGSWSARSVLGEGHRVTLRDRTLEGLLAPTRDGFILRTREANLKLAAADILSKERVRVPYEDYWDRDAALEERDAEGHYTLGLWAHSQKLEEVATREFRHAVIADPDHAGARKELGYQKKDGRWVRGR